jgi:hypothetical protein
MWPQCWDLQGPKGLEQRDLRKQNLGDLKKGPNGGVSPTPQKKTDDPICERCLEEDESVTRVLCDYEVIAYLTFHHLDQFFMGPSDY